jgi:hypothetical protein
LKSSNPNKVEERHPRDAKPRKSDENQETHYLGGSLPQRLVLDKKDYALFVTWGKSVMMVWMWMTRRFN